MKSSINDGLSQWFARNHGVVTVREAARLGVTHKDLRALIERGRLERRHQGVYLELPPRETRRLSEAAAALAAGGPPSALSHRTAAWQWELLAKAPGRVDLLVPFGRRSRLLGVTVHRSRVPFRPRSKNGLRLTDPIRTIVDIAATSPWLLTDVVDRALATRILRPTDLHAAAASARGGLYLGAAALRRPLLERGYLGAPAPSVLESQMARLFVRYGLPLPQAEYVAGENGEYRLDFAYPKLKFAVEVDGYAWHADPARMAADNARRNRLIAQGWRILTYTWVHLRDAPDKVAAEIRGVYDSLAAAGF